MKSKIFLLVLIIPFFFLSCTDNSPKPRPKAYFRISFPEKQYKLFDSNCPFRFEIPAYSFIIQENMDSCWMNIFFPLNNATIYLTYKPINNNLNEHVEDARQFVYKHTVKADAIEEIRYENDSLKVNGILYNLKGNTASSLQFVLTDSTNNFLRGALYFDVAPNKDSLAPVIDFIRKDMIHIMETLEWK